MVVEHEIIEQIEEEPVGRSLKWCVELAAEMGCADPLTTLCQMWRAGYLSVTDTEGQRLPDWHVEEIWRDGDIHSDVALLSTDLGSKWAHN